MGVASIAQLAPLFAVPSPPPDPARKGMTRGEIRVERRDKLKSGGTRLHERAEERNLAKRRDQEAKVNWTKKPKRVKEPALWPWPKAYQAVKRKKDVADKPNYMASTVNKGSYPVHLLGRGSLKQVWMNANQPSGLDSWDVPLYSSFTADNVFSGPFPAESTPVEKEPEPVRVEDLMESFVVKRKADGTWQKMRELSGAELGVVSDEDVAAAAAADGSMTGAATVPIAQGSGHRVPTSARGSSSLSMSRSGATDHEIKMRDLQPEPQVAAAAAAQQKQRPMTATPAGAERRTSEISRGTAGSREGPAAVVDPFQAAGAHNEMMRATASSLSSFSSRLLQHQRPDVTAAGIHHPGIPRPQSAHAHAQGHAHHHHHHHAHGAAKAQARPSSAPSHRPPVAEAAHGVVRRHSSAAGQHAAGGGHTRAIGAW